MHRRAREAGATRRQLEYWVEKGWVRPDAHAAERGRPRIFSGREMTVLSAMVRLVAAGFPAAKAAVIARKAVAVDGPVVGVSIGPDVTVVIGGLPVPGKDD